MLKTLYKALLLLKWFTEQKPTWGVRELATHAEIHYAEVHRVLATFEANGFLTKDSAGRYSLGLRLFELGQIVQRTLSMNDAVGPILSRLAEECGHTAFLSVLDGQEGLCLYAANSSRELRSSIEQGQRFALNAGAHAKAMLAFQPEAFRQAVYALAAPNDSVLLERQLAQIRVDGWSFTREEPSEAVAGLSVPIRSTLNQKVVGSLSIAGPSHQFDEDIASRALSSLTRAQAAIEPAFGLRR